MSKGALITGATGFIGVRLANRLLAEGFAVHAVARARSDVSGLPPAVHVHRYDGSIDRLKDIVADAAPDIVFHLASVYIADHQPHQIAELIESNIHFPVQLAEAMAAAGVSRLINTGTLSQHYDTRDYNPVSLYAATKQACMDLLRYFYEARGMSIVTLKLSDTYGAGDTRRKLVQLLVDAAMSGERIGMSPGHQILNLTHVEDVVGAFVVAAARLLSSERALNETYLVEGERLSVRELVSAVEQALDRPIHAEFGARLYRPREVMRPIEPTPSERLPGWQPELCLSETVAGLVRPAKGPEHAL